MQFCGLSNNEHSPATHLYAHAVVELPHRLSLHCSSVSHGIESDDDDDDEVEDEDEDDDDDELDDDEDCDVDVDEELVASESDDVLESEDSEHPGR